MRGGLKILSGTDVVSIYERFGFAVVGGAKHVKLRRNGPNGIETLIVPDHTPIGKGLLRTMFVQASAYIPQAQLRSHFYNE